MTDPYTYVSKPTGTPYSNTNVIGRQQYDESSLTFDDASTFYDSVDMSAYTIVSKPIGGATIRIGMATGLVMPPTYAKDYNVGSPYTNIPKPIN